MKQKLLALLRNRKLIYSLVLLAALVNGVAQTVITYDSSLGMGDNSTFYAFTRNIVDGEVMYKDFIHFRTPGTLTLFSGIMKFFGQQQSITDISTRVETLVLYPLLALGAMMIIFRKRSPYYVVLAFAGLAFFPGIAQLRAGFGLLAIAIYLLTFDETVNRRRLWLVLSGVLASVTFFFGQEIALMVGLCILAGEFLAGRKKTEVIARLKLILIGAGVAILPLLLYMLIFSDFGNFLYYTLYYSFVQQPKFMNTPFPLFRYENLIYYLPFVLYFLSSIVLYANKKLGIKEGILLSFGILRLITAVGRADFGHLLFSIPEVFIIVPYFIVMAKDADVRWKVLRAYAPYGLIVTVLMILSLHSGLALAPIPFVLLFALWKRKRTLTVPMKKTNGVFRLHLAIGVTFALFVFILTPTYISILKAIKYELTVDDSKALRIGGVKTDEANYKQIKTIQGIVDKLKPDTLFAFPIQPFYYSMAKHHASRFLTFEPQTTINEQDETIEDLKRTKPGVIIFDPLQAQGLSGSLWKISDYIMSNYDLHSEVVTNAILWVMVPKQTTEQNDKLAFQVYRDVANKDTATPIQSSDLGLRSAIAVNANARAQFSEESDDDDTLVLSISPQKDYGACGEVVISYDTKHSNKIAVCAYQGEISIPLEPHRHNISIRLQNNSSKKIIWNNPRIQ